MMNDQSVLAPQKRWKSSISLIASPLIFFILVLAVFAGPSWLRVIPDSLMFPVAEKVGDGINWFARDAKIAGVAMQEITRSIASFFDLIIDSTVVVLSKGIFTGRGLNVTQAVPPLSWLAIGGTLAIISYRLGGQRLTILTTAAVLFLVLFGLWQNAMVTLAVC